MAWHGVQSARQHCKQHAAYWAEHMDLRLLTWLVCCAAGLANVETDFPWCKLLKIRALALKVLAAWHALFHSASNLCCAVAEGLLLPHRLLLWEVCSMNLMLGASFEGRCEQSTPMHSSGPLATGCAPR